MKKYDLTGAFIAELHKKIPAQRELINNVASILAIEREAAYRRVTGRVSFSLGEMGQIAVALGISLDSLLYDAATSVWLPILLEPPMRLDSMDALARTMEDNLDLLARIAATGPIQRGIVCSSLPIEFFAGSPLMMRFMFFKWGHHFVRSDEFGRLAGWHVPCRLNAAIGRAAVMDGFSKALYVWDNALVWALAGEIAAFHRMHIITTDERDELRDELQDILARFERMLNGTESPPTGISDEAEFYVSSTGIGLTAGYFAAGDGKKDNDRGGVAMLHTNFSFCTIAAGDGRFDKMRDWVDAFRSISTLISGSGRSERRMFFARQREIIDWLLS